MLCLQSPIGMWNIRQSFNGLEKSHGRPGNHREVIFQEVYRNIFCGQVDKIANLKYNKIS